MTCKDISRSLAGSADLPPGADEHLRVCPSCRRLVALFGRPNAESELSPGAERRYLAAVTADLKPVSVLGPPWRYAAIIVATAAIVVVAGIAVLGRTGWATSSAFQKVYFTTALAAAILVSTSVLSRLMVPGALQRVPVWLLTLGSIVALAGGVILYPLAHYEHFGRAVAACFTIGTLHALAIGIACAVVLRRGFVVSRSTAATVAGLTGGLSGLVVLFVFCPHHDAGHYLLGHVSALVFATLFGPAMIYVWDAVKNQGQSTM
jgi:hypothetical protein